MSQPEPDDHDYLFKVIVIGDCDVGKTSLLRRFCYKSFDTQSNATVGVDFHLSDVAITWRKRNVKVKLQLWDTSGEEKYKSLTSVYYRNADCVLVVFDLNSRSSFESIPGWLSAAYDHCGDAHKVRSSLIVIFLW